MWEILEQGQMPYGSSWNNQEVKQKVIEGDRLPKPTSCEQTLSRELIDDLYEIMLSCWKTNPDERPPFQDLSDRFEREFQRQKKLEKNMPKEKKAVVDAYSPNPLKETHYDPIPATGGKQESVDEKSGKTHPLKKYCISCMQNLFLFPAW